MVDFVVEDGTGLEDATSYVSIDEAIDKYIVIYNRDDWRSLNTMNSDIVKEYLNQASLIIDLTFAPLGVKVSSTQSLNFPVYGVSTSVDYTVPKNLKFATCLMADHLRINGDTFSENSDEAIKKIKADTVTIEFNEYYSASKIPSSVGIYMSDLVQGYNNTKIIRTC